MQTFYPKQKNQSDYKLNILVLQTVTVAVILLFGVGIRIFGGEVYLKFSHWYHKNFDDITLASEVLTPENSEPIKSPQVYTESEIEGTKEQASDIENNTDETENTGEEYDNEIDGNVTGNITNLENVETTAVSGGVNTFLMPTAGEVVSKYGYRTHPITKKYTMHNGIDIAAKKGSDIYASFDGTVTSAGYSDSYGYYVIVSHSKNVETLYAHCSKLKVKKGETVKKGDLIALVGSTGWSTGPHLHFEIRVGGYRIDPEWMLGSVTEV